MRRRGLGRRSDVYDKFTGYENKSAIDTWKKIKKKKSTLRLRYLESHWNRIAVPSG
jgi:hypothetical protein